MTVVYTLYSGIKWWVILMAGPTVGIIAVAGDYYVDDDDKDYHDVDDDSNQPVSLNFKIQNQHGFCWFVCFEKRRNLVIFYLTIKIKYVKRVLSSYNYGISELN